MASRDAIPVPGPGCPPFVLLDDARAEGAAAARLFVDPVEIAIARSAAEVPTLLAALEAAASRGLHVAGYLSYEAGKGLAPAWRGPANVESGDMPLGWFGLFERARRIEAAAIPDLLPDPASAWVGKPRPRVARSDYLAAIEAVLELIRAGDIYQANFAFRADVPVAGNPLGVHARLRRTARAGYGGVIWTGNQAVVSHSPELFFALRDGRVMARPMKGTAVRLADAESDAAAAGALAVFTTPIPAANKLKSRSPQRAMSTRPSRPRPLLSRAGPPPTRSAAPASCSRLSSSSKRTWTSWRTCSRPSTARLSPTPRAISSAASK